jgi:hypothetical protein
MLPVEKMGRWKQFLDGMSAAFGEEKEEAAIAILLAVLVSELLLLLPKLFVWLST